MFAPKEPSKVESEPGKDPRDLIATIVSMPRLWSLVAGRTRHAHLSCDKCKCLERKKWITEASPLYSLDK